MKTDYFRGWSLAVSGVHPPEKNDWLNPEHEATPFVKGFRKGYRAWEDANQIRKGYRAGEDANRTEGNEVVTRILREVLMFFDKPLQGLEMADVFSYPDFAQADVEALREWLKKGKEQRP